MGMMECCKSPPSGTWAVHFYAIFVMEMVTGDDNSHFSECLYIFEK